MNDITSPAHYIKGRIECLDFIQDFLTAEEFRGAMKAMIIQYIYRHPDKGGVKDLKKAQFYLNRLIEHEEIVEFEKSVR